MNQRKEMSMLKQIMAVSMLLTTVAVLSGEELALKAEIPLADVELMDVSGEKTSLGAVKGDEGLVVIFSSNTCPWVGAWEDRYVELAATYQDRGIGFIALNSNSANRNRGESYADMQQHARDKGYNFSYVVDEGSRLATAFGATRTPHVFIFNGEGNLVYRGAIDDNARHSDKVEQAYAALACEAVLGDREPVAASTKALGCSIKYSD